MKLSVCIITLNEEKNIKKCLESVKDLATEIVIVDSGSTDKTVAIAKKYGAKTYTHKFKNYGNQKNFAAKKATGEWLYFVDADEETPKALGKEIKDAITKNSYDGYLIPRRNILLGKEIKHSRWSPDKHIWLYKKSKGSWQGEIHEEVVVKGSVGELKTAKIHHSYATVTEFNKMVDSYTELTANTLLADGKRFSLFRLIADPLLSFSRRYVYKKGFLDGKEGLVLAILMARYRALTWIKVYKFQNEKKD